MRVHVHALARRVKDADDLGRAGPRRAHAVRHDRVELGRFAGYERELLLAELEAEPAREHVEPLVAVMHLRFAYRGVGPVRDLERSNG